MHFKQQNITRTTNELKVYSITGKFYVFHKRITEDTLGCAILIPNPHPVNAFTHILESGTSRGLKIDVVVSRIGICTRCTDSI